MITEHNSSTAGKGNIQDFFVVTGSFMDHTQQVNLLFAMKHGVPELKQQLSDIDNHNISV